MLDDWMDAASIAYYETHAAAFFADTVALDLSPLYARFLERLPAGGHLLDAGCGSGRDARAFLQRGYAVTAFDASPTLARLASAHCGLPVPVLRVQDMAWQEQFDGIWACASLLHVPLRELPEVLRRLAAALKPGGILYASFKYGQGEREQRGRRFTDMDEAGLAALLQAAPYFTVLETWITADQRLERVEERWLNARVQKPSACALFSESRVDRLDHQPEGAGLTVGNQEPENPDTRWIENGGIDETSTKGRLEIGHR
jgi:SAM-dependent methyltransferase